jgi:hypothetical protein
MTSMIRKQIYIQRRQQAVLSRLARRMGVSEAEVIRRAIDNQSRNQAVDELAPDPTAWQEAYRVMCDLHAQGPLPTRRRTWRRADLYAEG